MIHDKMTSVSAAFAAETKYQTKQLVAVWDFERRGRS
jgi:hypothetical protein